MLLATLYENLTSKDKILTGAKVQTIKTLQNGVEVVTADGREFKGDLLLGADGVYSVTRQEMWRHANEMQSAAFPQEDWNGERPHASIYNDSAILISTLHRCLLCIQVHFRHLQPSESHAPRWGAKLDEQRLFVSGHRRPWRPDLLVLIRQTFSPCVRRRDPEIHQGGRADTGQRAFLGPYCSWDHFWRYIRSEDKLGSHSVA